MAHQRRSRVDPWSVFYVLVIVGVVLAWPVGVLVRDDLHDRQEGAVLTRWEQVYADCKASGGADCGGTAYDGCINDDHWAYSDFAGAFDDQRSYATSACPDYGQPNRP